MHKLIDKLIIETDNALRTLLPPKERAASRVYPAKNICNDKLSAAQIKHIIGLIRVDHAGEVCAQALYQGQALTAKLTDTKDKMAQAAQEEIDHLAWCEKRLNELGGKPSIANPLWYGSSFLIGALAGLVGDKFSLGFVAETEKQVGQHLKTHLAQLPLADKASKALLEAMYLDESQHAENAFSGGAIELPLAIKKIMTKVSKVMTSVSYYL